MAGMSKYIQESRCNIPHALEPLKKGLQKWSAKIASFWENRCSERVNPVSARIRAVPSILLSSCISGGRDPPGGGAKKELF